jgi:hypothetical protein
MQLLRVLGTKKPHSYQWLINPAQSGRKRKLLIAMRAKAEEIHNSTVTNAASGSKDSSIPRRAFEEFKEMV